MFAFVCWCVQGLRCAVVLCFGCVLIMWLVVAAVCCGCRFDFGW